MGLSIFLISFWSLYLSLFFRVLHELPVGHYQVSHGTIKQWVKLIWHAFWGFDHFACSTYLFRSSMLLIFNLHGQQVLFDCWKLKVDGPFEFSNLTLIIFLVPLFHELPVGHYHVSLGTIKHLVKLIWHAFWGFDHFACSTYLIRSSNLLIFNLHGQQVLFDCWKLKVDGPFEFSSLTLIFLSIYCTGYPLGSINFYLVQLKSGLNQCDWYCWDSPIPHAHYI